MLWILLLLAKTGPNAAVDCPDLQTIANMDVATYSATPHVDGSTVTITCLTVPFIYVPNPITSITCNVGIWERVPECSGCSNCNAGCNHNSHAVSLLFLPGFCHGSGYRSGDLNGDGFCDNFCHTLTLYVYMLYYDNVTRSFVAAEGTNNGLYADQYCGNQPLFRDVNRDGYVDILCTITNYTSFIDTFILWGKSGGHLNVLDYTRHNVMKSELFCVGPYPEKMLSCGVRCSDSSAMKFGRFCFISAGPSTYNRYENTCSSFGMDYPLVEDNGDLAWFVMAREYFGMLLAKTWVSAVRVGNSFTWNTSNADFLPWTPGHPNPIHNCALVSGDSLEIQSEDCSIAHKQLCQGDTVIPAMCPAPVVDNGTVSCNLMSKPENSVASVTCDFGFRQNDTTTNGSMTCGTDFNWIPKIGCVEISACTIFTIANGMFDYQHATRIGRSSCDAKHYLRGQAEVFCRADGTWNGPIPPICAAESASTTFQLVMGKTLAEFTQYSKLSTSFEPDVVNCTWKCKDNLGCNSALYDRVNEKCDLYGINPKLMGLTAVLTTSNYQLIIFQ